jgi:HNH endonuclease
MGASFGAKNGFWKGGRSVASNGYVLVRVGKGHHLADVRGYAYEHRLVGETMLGRRLRPGEQIHHRDDSFEGRSNNDPSNLLVMASAAQHLRLHRKRDVGLREPWEANCEVACRCGCGRAFLRFDAAGRPREYLLGHNAADRAPRTEAVLSAIAAGATTAADVICAVGGSPRATRVILSRLVGSESSPASGRGDTHRR